MSSFDRFELGIRSTRTPNIMVKGICILFSALTPLLCALLATTAALPASLSVANATLLQLSNGTSTFTSSIPVGSWEPYHYRTVILKLASFGQAIPESEVKNTLVSADLVVGEFLDRHADESIPNDRFEYQRPDGNMIIAIKARVYHQIPWLSLYDVLKALEGFMTASRPFRKPHYESLEFEIELTGKPEVAGTGLVWYLPPGSDQVQKRAIATAPSSIANHTLLQLTNATSLSLGATADEDIPYHIPRTSLTLSFYYAEVPLPRDEVIAAIRGAMAYVSPQATGPYKSDTIPGGLFQWVRPDSVGVTTRVAVTVFFSKGYNVSWKQLYDVLYGLYQFATGMNGARPQYEMLGFRILDPNGKLGVGTLSYFEPEPREVERRAETTNENFGESAVVQAENSTILPQSDSPNGTPLQLPNTQDIAPTVPVPVPVPGTDIVFTFTLFGDPIIPRDLFSVLGAAQVQIAVAVRTKPTDPIPNNHFRYVNHDGSIAVSIIAYLGETMSWLQLHLILNGLSQFCSQGHTQGLVFEIDILGSRVGFGVLQPPSDPSVTSAVVRRALNQSFFPPINATPLSSPVAATTNIVFPITDGNLAFRILGRALPRPEVTELFERALKTVDAMRLNIAIPSDEFEFTYVQLTISVRTYEGVLITWSQLARIIYGLMDFMMPNRPQLQSHSHELHFQINLNGLGRIGHGHVTSWTSGGVKDDKTALSPTLSLPRPSTTAVYTTYPIPGTPMTLDINPFGYTAISPAEMNAALTGALSKIYPHLAREGDQAIPDNQWGYGDVVTSVLLSIMVWVGSTLSWQQLSWVITGLLQWMTGPGRSDIMTVSFDFKISGKGGGKDDCKRDCEKMCQRH